MADSENAAVKTVQIAGFNGAIDRASRITQRPSQLSD
jgi:hypothetical protein